jgi:predicted metal-dependent RNase
MQFCKEAGFFEVVFEGDAAQVVAEINSGPPHLSKSGHFVESICQEIHYLPTIDFKHVHQESNMAAHVMAKHALTSNENRCWLEDIPNCIFQIVCREQFFPYIMFVFRIKLFCCFSVIKMR